jgi:hypothetical protein
MSRQHKFEAEVLFKHADVARAVSALAAADCTYVINTDITDEDYTFGWVCGATELDEMEVSDWLAEIVDPLGGDIVEWCICELRDRRLKMMTS